MTGDNFGNLNPESPIKRREIAAVLMRMIEKDRRIVVGQETPKDDTPADTGTPDDDIIPVKSITLYNGDRTSKTFTGITGFAAEFSISGSTSTVGNEYTLDHINSLVLEPDNISFRLYTGSGYEALGIVRGWMNEAARGKNGSAIRDKNDVFSKINDLAYLWVDGTRMEISELWYADHGEYTTYAFYFDKDIDPLSIKSLEFAVGRFDSDTLSAHGLADLYDAITNSGIYDVISPDGADDTASDNYKAAISDAKDTAHSIIFEKETSRCMILYGRGLYGRENDEYRLIFVFRDGTTQTVASQKLENIRMNSAGNILYYEMTGPDGKNLQYGINFGE